METKRSETVISRFLVFFSYRLHILYQSIKEELMDQFNVYKDMKARTNGEIYIGVVGPVRTGKSTFIKRFMNLMVLPSKMKTTEIVQMTNFHNLQVVKRS